MAIVTMDQLINAALMVTIETAYETGDKALDKTISARKSAAIKALHYHNTGIKAIYAGSRQYTVQSSDGKSVYLTTGDTCSCAAKGECWHKALVRATEQAADDAALEPVLPASRPAAPRRNIPVPINALDTSDWF